MTKKTHPPRLSTTSDCPRQPTTTAGGPHSPGPFVALRIAELSSLTGQAELALDYVRRLDRSARLVIGGSLQARLLDRATLERLRASVTRQAGEATQVLRQLSGVAGSDSVRDELGDLIEFFAGALAEIDRQLRQVH